MNSLQQIDDAVFIQNQQVKTTSLKVADIFNKQHKDVLRKLENLECSSNFTERNFTLSEYVDTTGRKLPMFEMTKDGFIFLVMGFTGATAAKIKEAYINTFNQMAAMLYNEQGNHQHIHVGATVQLKSGGPLYTVSRIQYDTNGLIQDAEVIWHDKAKLCREILPVTCLSTETKSILNQKGLHDFWLSIQNYGLNKLNHSRKADTIALNITEVYQCIDGLPSKSQLSAILMQSKSPYPIYMQHNHAVSSVLTQKTLKCWIFKSHEQYLLN